MRFCACAATARSCPASRRPRGRKLAPILAYWGEQRGLCIAARGPGCAMALMGHQGALLMGRGAFATLLRDAIKGLRYLPLQQRIANDQLAGVSPTMLSCCVAYPALCKGRRPAQSTLQGIISKPPIPHEQGSSNQEVTSRYQRVPYDRCKCETRANRGVCQPRDSSLSAMPLGRVLLTLCKAAIGHTLSSYCLSCREADGHGLCAQGTGTANSLESSESPEASLRVTQRRG